jgi:GNAT superfamily N-acetyltransferase
MNNKFEIIPATKKEIPVILSFIKSLAQHVALSHEVVATEKDLEDTLFNSNSDIDVAIGYYEQVPVSFVLFFPNYSTFLAKPGIYVEDLYIKPEYRGRGLGKAIFSYLAKLAIERNCGKIEWNAVAWNDSAIDFYDNIGAVVLEGRKVFRLAGDPLQHLADCN